MKFLFACSIAFFIFPNSAVAIEPAGTELSGKTYHRLFTIRRSLNENELVYEARLTSEGKFYVQDPIQIYWIMRTEGNALEPPTSFENHSVYGVIVNSAKEDEVTFSLKAFANRPITIQKTEKNGAWAVWASMSILGKACRIESIFIELKTGRLIPKVNFIEVKGLSNSSGEKVVERIIPD